MGFFTPIITVYSFLKLERISQPKELTYNENRKEE